MAEDTRRRLIAKIHIMQAEQGLDDTAYRMMLERITGKRSCAKMSPQELAWQKQRLQLGHDPNAGAAAAGPATVAGPATAGGAHGIIPAGVTHEHRIPTRRCGVLWARWRHRHDILPRIAEQPLRTLLTDRTADGPGQVSPTRGSSPSTGRQKWFRHSRSLTLTCWLNQLRGGDSGCSFLAVRLDQLGAVGLLRICLNVVGTCSITTDASCWRLG